MQKRLQEKLKRAFDIVAATSSLPVVLPIIFIIGLLNRIESPGSIFFTQQRVGKRNNFFHVIKLRTMVPGAEKIGAGLYYAKNDPRFTRVGLLARRFSLDELPQVFNVLKGQMSIVGPRPQLPIVVNDNKEDYDVILQVNPGITGLAQVSGRNELVRSQRIELDKKYAQNWSLPMDLKIIFKTISVVFKGEGQRIDQSREDVEK